MQRELAMVDCAMFLIKNKEQRCYTSSNVNLKTCTYNFYLSLHIQKSPSPLLSSVCAIYQHRFKHSATQQCYRTCVTPLQVQGIWCSQGPLQTKTSAFWSHSQKTYFQAVSELWQMSDVVSEVFADDQLD